MLIIPQQAKISWLVKQPSLGLTIARIIFSLLGHCSVRENEGYRINICMTLGFHLSSDEII